jgi:long-chain acyl-CoA synthetase
MCSVALALTSCNDGFVLNIFDRIRLQAEKQPEQVAYWYHEPSKDQAPLTYAELVKEADALADRLRSRGMLPGERCGLLLPEGPEFLVHALGILSAGLCLAPIGRFLPQTEIDFNIQAAELHWLIQAPQKWIKLPFAKPIDLSGDKDYRAIEPAFIRFTSGSTGKRKGVLLGHNTIHARLDCADEILQIQAQDRIWFQLAMVDHFVVSTLLYLSRGASIFTAAPSVPPKHWDEWVKRIAPTVIYASPDFYQELNESSVPSLPDLKVAISTTAPLQQSTQTEFASRFNHPLSAALGIIECGLLTLNQSLKKKDSIGQPMPSYRMTIVRERDGSPLSQGETGELHIQGDGLLDAYLHPWRAQSEILGPYGYATGDFAWIDKEGYLFLVGRGQNRLTVKGLAFFCEEIETLLNNLPGIIESRVYLDRTTGKLAAELVGAPPNHLTPHLPSDLDPRKIPTTYRTVSKLPRTPNGKLLRKATDS